MVFDREMNQPASPDRRKQVLDREIAEMTSAGYLLVKQIDHTAVFQRPNGTGRIQVFVDGDGNLRLN